MSPSLSHRARLAALTAAALALPVAASAQAPSCPGLGWSEGLVQYQGANAAFPTNDTPVNAQDCQFHQWSYEAFVWATWPDGNGVPRFMTLPTPEELLSPSATATGPRQLKLAARSVMAHGTPGYTEGTGAFVEADGNVLVAPNGYPVYGSVHINPSYFNTAKQNLIVNGGYQSQPQNATFSVGAAVFKATWLRLAPGEQPPAGTFTTQVQVPILTVLRTKTTIAIVPAPGQFTTATVALVGLHVVGHTINHPEFVWGTFEHRLNSPATADNTFSTSGSNPNNFTFYQANTPYSVVNHAFTPPNLTFNTATQRFSPPTNVVLENRTGGENQRNGVSNVLAVNSSGQSFLRNQRSAQAVFANYNLIGTVWMQANSYNNASNQTNAIGSVNLANATAETFVQNAKNTPMSGVQNCFMCHNATSYSFQSSPPPLATRLIALSHVLGVGTPYAVPNAISGPVKSQR